MKHVSYAPVDGCNYSIGTGLFYMHFFVYFCEYIEFWFKNKKVLR